MTDYTFAELGLAERLQRALAGAGYQTPTPIQAQAIPLLLEGHDLFGIAQTGTGKTAAFVLPLLQKLDANSNKPGPRQAGALILAPTRELVNQISDNIEIYAQYLPTSQAVVMGGVGQRPQIAAMRAGVDILVATPGRLLDLMGTGHIDLSGTQHLILDEADRMLDMGFIRDVRRILKQIPRRRQTLLFSATMPAEVTQLAKEILEFPRRVEIVAKTVAVDRIEQRVHHLARSEKRARLAALLDAPDLQRAIVFTRTKHGANRVVKQLASSGLTAEAIHGNKTQAARQRALDGFRNGQFPVLVATDIAARGIDVDDVTHVINYELPNTPESYLHRIGRTARAGAAGIAISLCDETELPYLRAIERLIKQPLTVVGQPAIELAATRPDNSNKGATPSTGPSAKRRGRRRGRKTNSRAA